ncbi:MAG TPA: 16S rRNA (cytosine(1402)-N(4))-methyltransferase RsmH [Mesotoga sp.]|nr:16S rRNA (cytosine(1402)-N(4))-methyltransferase RsmH [Mesotoga sp.]NLX33665.1 16S rRNA (cytosine(1402)-N(4))-methyltransferase RsmH [Thermotogaceae bacterium]MDD4040443.1 16S rRNA (cytosine(1402)-N(4))-methyltransferase RsmH [Mesotoga sp.]MDD4478186.1 16S rRNA (cytosine(1402)-N(4))-methyltransferase RsmH [Mesotoga sp.]MDD5744592.1 16S rRNA (cytosine(1402)-N(4))-methyltransferase RsmH [Mesotoga sp.]
MSRQYDEHHRSVMIHEALHYLLSKQEGGLYFDCTAGEGGHIRAILEATKGLSRVVGLDVDREVLELAERNLKDYQGCFQLFNLSYANFEIVLRQLGVTKVDGFLLDVGVSTFQLKSLGRGFSYDIDEPLDMRMDLSRELTAERVVNGYSEKDLARIIFEYGEEQRFARKIARSIVSRRPLYSTKDLVEAIKKAIPPAERYKRKRHFATRTFQAIRIEVNDELENIEKTLRAIPCYLNPGGRVVIISFHSLEDGIAKRVFREKMDIELKILTKKPLSPSEEEIDLNLRARSARLRAAERI